MTLTQDEYNLVENLADKIIRGKPFVLWGQGRKIRSAVILRVKQIKSGIAYQKAMREEPLVATKEGVMPESYVKGYPTKSKTPTQFEKDIVFRKLTPIQQLKKLSTKAKASEAFISQRQTGTFRGTPIMEIVVTNKRGNIVRKATIEEAKEFRKRSKTVEVFRDKRGIIGRRVGMEKTKFKERYEKRIGEPSERLVKSITSKLKELKVSQKIIREVKEGKTPLHKLIKKLPKEKQKPLLNLLTVEAKFIKGAVKGVEEEPEKTLVIAVASFFSPAVLARLGGTKYVASILKFVPSPIKKKGAWAVSKFLTTAYATTTGLTILKEPKGQKAVKAGKIFSTEILPFYVGTKLGVKGYLRNEVKKEIKIELDKLPPNKKTAFKEYMKQAELLGKYESTTKNIKLSNIESIKNTKAQEQIRKWLKANKREVIVGGSVAQTGQIDVKRKLGDIDLYLETKSPTKTAKQLANSLKKAGVKRVSSVKGQVTIEGHKAIEFHKVDRLLTNIEQVIPSWQNPRRYIIKTPEGIRIQRLGLQIRRKLVAAFADPKRLKTGKYKKDLKDFKRIADKLFRKAELSARSSYFFKKKKIKRLEKMFGKKFIKELKIREVKIKKVRLKRIKKIKKLKVKKLKKVKVKKIKKPVKIKKAKIRIIKKRKRIRLEKKIKRFKKERILKIKRGRRGIKKISRKLKQKITLSQRKILKKRLKKLRISQRRIRKKKLSTIYPKKIKRKKKPPYPPIKKPKKPPYPPIKKPKKPPYPPIKKPKKPP